VTLLIDRLCSIGTNGTQAAACLKAMADVTTIFIPVYGRLALPAPLPAWRWRQFLRTALLNAAAPGDANWIAGKTGPWMSPLLASLIAG
jgi:hypothetical protein